MQRRRLPKLIVQVGRSGWRQATGACADEAGEVQQPSTATAPDSRQPPRPSTNRASWDDSQTPRGAASSGRRGHACAGQLKSLSAAAWSSKNDRCSVALLSARCQRGRPTGAPPSARLARHGRSPVRRTGTTDLKVPVRQTVLPSDQAVCGPALTFNQQVCPSEPRADLRSVQVPADSSVTFDSHDRVDVRAAVYDLAGGCHLGRKLVICDDVL